MGVVEKHAVRETGRADGQPMLFAHGFGCDQNMWRFVTPAFEPDYRVIAFDYLGAGHSDLASYDSERYSSLTGYADDIIEICQELDLHDVVFVGHSVSAMIGALVAVEQPHLFAKLVMVGPSPRYIDSDDYLGGFTESDIDELLASLESNYLGWSSAIAPAIMANPDRPGLGMELVESFCRTDPEVALQFARVTFMSDNRSDLAKVAVPTLVLQCRDDIIAPISVGEYVQRALPDGQLVVLDATGHCPHLSAPEQTVAAIAAFLE